MPGAASEAVVLLGEVLAVDWEDGSATDDHPCSNKAAREDVAARPPRLLALLRSWGGGRIRLLSPRRLRHQDAAAEQDRADLAGVNGISPVGGLVPAPDPALPGPPAPPVRSPRSACRPPADQPDHVRCTKTSSSSARLYVTAAARFGCEALRGAVRAAHVSGTRRESGSAPIHSEGASNGAMSLPHHGALMPWRLNAFPLTLLRFRAGGRGRRDLPAWWCPVSYRCRRRCRAGACA